MREIKLIQAIDDQSSVTSQNFSVINLGTKRLGFEFRYNTMLDRWFFNLAVDDDFVLYGQKIVLNTNLLTPHGFGVGVLFAFDTEGTGNEPTYNAILNRSVRLYHASALEQFQLLTG